jgi:hypothetical protein
MRKDNTMTEQSKGPQPKPGQTRPAPRVDANRQRDKAEAGEVAGRHKNTGQKDHKGAR